MIPCIPVSTTFLTLWQSNKALIMLKNVKGSLVSWNLKIDVLAYYFTSDLPYLCTPLKNLLSARFS